MAGRRPIVVCLSVSLTAWLIVGLAGCSRPKAGAPGAVGGASKAGATIRQTGSTTLLPLAEKWRQAFDAQHPEVNIAVSGGGSGTGIKALIAGTAEIADSSREIKPEETQQAQAAGVKPVEHLVAYDGIAVIVHPSNPLKEISFQTLSDIFTGKIRKWDAAGAKGLGEMQLVSRDSASGTYEAFKDMVVTLDGKDKSRDYAASSLKQSSNQAVLNLVAQTKSAIGYVGLGYLNSSVKVLAVVPLQGGAAVQPTAENVLNHTYPISRKLYCYTNGEPSGALKDYLDWIKGPEGQDLVKKLGFVPLP